MEGPPRDRFTSLRLTRSAESSRLKLELVRRAFELIVPHNHWCYKKSARITPPSTDVADSTRAKGA
jgi:hypothetical protein